MNELPIRYDPNLVENKWVHVWNERNLFYSEPDSTRTPFVIVIPPPNVTGYLHIGHALNNVLQDVLIRYQRMIGKNTLWVPGTDHGGIATQNVVEKLLRKQENLTRDKLGRDEFIRRMWQWRQETGDTILNQLQLLGCACDWSRVRFTMDEICSRSVVAAFIELYRRGIIYRGKRIVNWCVRCRTAIADIEVDHQETKGSLWYIRYPIKDSDGYITVATTRPETMLGDTAIAVNPQDTRYTNLIGKTVFLPLLGREIPIIADDLVESEFGTGAVKVTPSHDPVDFEIAQRHNLKHIPVIDLDGTMTPWVLNEKYIGIDRSECRKQVVSDLDSDGKLEKTDPYVHSVGHCYRCHTVVEPLELDQWFIRTDKMAAAAVSASKKGEVTFYPSSWEKPYLNWLENLKDWCISRQIWWGHRIPIWYCIHCRQNNIEGQIKFNGDVYHRGKVADFIKQEYTLEYISRNFKEDYLITGDISDGKGIYPGENPPLKCTVCANTHFIQDPDVLDTWFSSALWPFSVFGWINEPSQDKDTRELNYYYPTSVLVTGYEILYLWVARMVMLGLTFLDKVPFKQVYIHGIVRDITGKKMSKSLGNVINPLDIVAQYGTDALRYTLVSASTTGRDLQIAEDSFISARNFTNKIWNAARYVLQNVQTKLENNPEFKFVDLNSSLPLSLADRWILNRFNQTIEKIYQSVNEYNLAVYARIVYEFFWDDFCDWYIELAKITISSMPDNESVRDHQRTDITEKEQIVFTVLIHILSGTLKILHPIIPFITEELWTRLHGLFYRLEPEFLVLTNLPAVDKQWINSSCEPEMQLIIDTVCTLRNIRSEMNIHPRDCIDVLVKVPPGSVQEVLVKNQGYIVHLVKIKTITFAAEITRPEHAVSAVTDKMELFVPLEGLVDFGKEKERLTKKLNSVNQDLTRSQNKFANPDFITHAPEQEIVRIKEYINTLEHQKSRLLSYLDSL